MCYVSGRARVCVSEFGPKKVGRKVDHTMGYTTLSARVSGLSLTQIIEWGAERV